MSSRGSVPDFSGLRIAVVGDLIADHYLVCEPRGLSREAPVMVLRHQDEYVGAGGAANVARNVRALGARTMCLGIVGRDARGRELIELFEREAIDATRVVTALEWSTPTKTRIVAAEPRRNLQQVLRVDRDPRGAPPASLRERLLWELERAASELDAVIVSDYEYGVVDSRLGEVVARMARAGVVVVLDPRSELDGFAGITALTPNVGELAHFTRRDPDRLADSQSLAEAARQLLTHLPVGHLLVTRGNRGMALFGEGELAHGVGVEASGSGNVTDPTGAGDTAAAVFALALAAGADAPHAMRLANAASGVVVMENGCAVCTRDQLAAALGGAPSPTRLVGVGPL